MKFLLDASVPVAVGEVLAEAGHEIVFYNEVLGENVKDVVVSQTALAENAVLIVADRDFKRLRRNEDRFGRLGLLCLDCSLPQAANRVAHLLPMIEKEGEQCDQLVARTFTFVIRGQSFQIHR